MRIYAVDDETLAREMLEEALKEALEEIGATGDVEIFSNPIDCLKRIREQPCDILLSDIRMPEMDGVELAKTAMDIVPQLNVVFITAYNEYMSDAFDMYVSGYLQKPVTAEKIVKVMRHLRYPIDNAVPKCKVQCYGNFEVFDRTGKPLHFHRSKSKECMAYLILKKGASCTLREIAAVLFEDMPYDIKQIRYVQKVVSALASDMKENGFADAIIKEYNGIAVNVDAVECDYYSNPDRMKMLEEGEEFMAQYSWAETIYY